MEYLDSPHVQPAPTDQELQVSSWEVPVAGSLLGWCHRQHLARQGHPGSGPKSGFQWKMWHVRYVRYVIHCVSEHLFDMEKRWEIPWWMKCRHFPSSMAFSIGVYPGISYGISHFQTQPCDVWWMADWTCEIIRDYVICDLPGVPQVAYGMAYGMVAIWKSIAFLRD